MSIATFTAWSGLAVDGGLVLLLIAVLVELRRRARPEVAALEARLREAHDALRLLVAQAEGQARELDERLAALAPRLEQDAAPPRGRARATEKARTPARSGPPLVDRVARLAAAQTPVDEIARTLGVSLAEARVLAGLSGHAAKAPGARAVAS